MFKNIFKAFASNRACLPFRLLVTVVISLVFFATFASARTLSVPESSPTIKGALIKAKPGDIVLVSCGTYYEYNIRMKPGVALWSGTLQPGCVTIAAQGKGRHFIMADSDSNTALVGFTLTGGAAGDTDKKNGGALLCINSSPRISNCVFKDNTAQNGGAIACDKNSRPLFANCLFENNTATASGGSVSSAGETTFRQCGFEKNQALVGGAIFLTEGSNTKIRTCSFQNNSAGNTGGGLHLAQATAEISNTILAGNWGGIGGSAISLSNSDLKVTRSTLYKNLADSHGATLAIIGNSPQFKNCIIAFGNGDVLRSDSEVPQFQGCNLFGNKGGDWVANLSSLANKFDNISSDPMFCSPDFGNFNLNNSSSCLPGNNPSGNKGIIGAFGPGCASADNIPSESKQSGSGFRAIKAGF